MKLHNQYLLLHSRYGVTGEVPVTLDEVAEVLDCTHRNAVTILHKMAEHQWIAWNPQRGRARRSLLRFLALPEEIAVISMMHAVDRKDIKTALDRISSHTRSSAVQDRLQGWLLRYFGHHSEIRSNKQIDTLRLPVRHALQTADPLYINLLAESFVSSHVFDGLARRTDRSGDILPHLAHAWEVDPSRTSWTFFLRKEVLFHNGRVMSADDVAYSLERLIRTSRPMLYSFIFKRIKSVRALNPATVRIELEEPNELFLPFLCTSRAAIVPKDLERLGEAGFGTHPVGTGPFKLTEWNERGCVLQAFTPYFKERAHLDRVEIVHVPWDTGSGQATGAEGGLSPFHVIHNPAGSEETWSQIHSAVSVRKFVTCNTQKAGPLRDPAVRAHLLFCLSEDSVPAANPKDREQRYAVQMATIAPYRQDAEKAAKKLESCGYTCTINTVSVEDFKGPVRLESDLILFSLIRDQDEQLRLYDLFLTISGHVDAHTRVDIEKWLHAVTQEPDPDARLQGFAAIEARLQRESQFTVLSDSPVQTAFLPTVRGVTFNSQGWVDLRNIWFPPSV